MTTKTHYIYFFIQFIKKPLNKLYNTTHYTIVPAFTGDIYNGSIIKTIIILHNFAIT